MAKRVYPGALLVALLALSACGGGSNIARVGAQAPGWTQTTSTGSKLSMASLSGKPVYLNFFATWCIPCNEEAPFINAMQKKYAARGLQIVGIDELENAAATRRFVRRFGLVYPAVVDDGALESAYLINGLPVHVFIARDGTVMKMTVGEMSKAQIESSIRALL